jgi:hypothetical protein
MQWFIAAQSPTMTAYGLRSDQRQAIIEAIRRGELTIAEAASLAGIPTPTVWRWCKARKINSKAARARHASLVFWRIMSGKRLAKDLKRERAAEAFEDWQTR